MAFQFDVTTRNDWLTTLATQLGASAKLYIYSGSVPSSCAAGATGTLLSSGIRGNSGGFGTVSGGVLTASPISADPSAAATGVAGYFRWLDSSNNVHMQGVVSLPGGGGDLIMQNTEIQAGDTVTITSCVITAPGA